ncbi:MAG: RidA family protein [Alphaproteobacteria bacterium]
MSQLKRIEAGARMSEAVIHGDKIYTCGIVADKAAGRDVYQQTEDILEQIDALLAQAGSDKTRIIKANIWLSDMATFAEMNQAWDAWVVAGSAPARATVEAKLAAAEYAVEIMIEAVI